VLISQGFLGPTNPRSADERSHAGNTLRRPLGRVPSLYREAFPAAALALHVRVAETEGFVQSLLDEIHDRAVEQAQAARIDEYLHPPVLEHYVPRGRLVGVVDDVCKPRAPGLTDAELQTDAVSAGGQEGFDTIRSGFSQ
jgi:hypothetical protein